MKKIICILLIIAALFTLSCDVDYEADADASSNASSSSSSSSQSTPKPPHIGAAAPDTYDYLAMESAIFPMRQDIYAVKGNYSLPMNIFAPAVENDNNEIAILCIHGGGWNTSLRPHSTFSGDWMRHQARYYASLGFWTLEITYRSMNQGFDITDLQADAEDAMRYINQTLVPELGFGKIIAIGDSAGGHLVMCLALSADASVRPYAVIACNPVSNCLDDMWRGGVEDDEVSKTVSPLHMAKATETKLLIMHGTADTVVATSDTTALCNALRAYPDNDVQLRWLDGAEHAFILYGWYDRNDPTLTQKITEYMAITVEYIYEIL